MWKPANSLEWQRKSLCAKPTNKDKIDWFFSSESEKKSAAKNICFECPVRKECLQWALEHKQIWGVWGGKDEYEIRRTLSVSYLGEETKRSRYPNCPFCAARPNRLETDVVQLEGPGRWNTAKIVICNECGFMWKSRTSANAVDSYKLEKSDKIERKKREKEKEKIKKNKKVGRPKKQKTE
jgi:WhiB family redox-sensing transcriptional regulator